MCWWGAGEHDVSGGGDIPEAVLEGLTDSAAKNPWVAQASGKKVWVLVADAPGHPENQKECEDLVKAAAAKGFHLYAVKLQGPHAAPDQSAMDSAGEDWQWGFDGGVGCGIDECQGAEIACGDEGVWGAWLGRRNSGGAAGFKCDAGGCD